MASARSRAMPESRAASMRSLTCVPKPTCKQRQGDQCHERQAQRFVATTGFSAIPSNAGVGRVQEQLHDDERHHQVGRDDPRRQSVRDDAAAEPSFETHQQERGDGRPQDSRIAAVMTPGRDRGRENQEADGDAEQTVQVLRPHQRRVEQRGIELRRQVRHRSRRDPSAKTARPVRATEPGAGRAHQAADQNQQVGGSGRRECKALKRREAHADIMAACATSPLRRAITP